MYSKKFFKLSLYIMKDIEPFLILFQAEPSLTVFTYDKLKGH